MKIDKDYIINLTQKYYECETTLEEENILNEYFNSGNVDIELSHLAPQFVYYKESVAETISESFDEMILNNIDKQVNTPKVRQLFTKKAWMYSAAALVILSVGINLIFSKNKIEVTGNNSIEKNEFAYQETVSALMFISSKMALADSQLNNMEILSKNLNQLNQVNQFEKLKYLEKIIKKDRRRNDQ